jgi:hypothetical protein
MEKSVMEKKSRRAYRRYPAGFREKALERLKHTKDIKELAKELGVSRGVLYQWKWKAEERWAGRETTPEDEPSRRIRELEAQVASLEGELGRRSLEASFFKSALRRVEGTARRNEELGETPSTVRRQLLFPVSDNYSSLRRQLRAWSDGSGGLHWC